MKIRVGFIINYKSTSWLGGYNYFKNLFKCLKDYKNSKISPIFEQFLPVLALQGYQSMS